MKVGVSSWFANLGEFERRTREGRFERAPRVTDSEQIKKELALVDLVEPLGFDSFWTIEHHFTPYGMTDNPTQILSYVAGRTSRVELGTMVLVLPWHDPLKLAENLAILDVLLDGRRLNIGVGRGFAAREFNAFRVPYEESRGRMIECLEIVRRALTEEFFSFEGEFFNIPRTTIRPRPLSPDLTENLLMTWASTESLELAALSGAAPLFTNYRGWSTLEDNLRSFNALRANQGWSRSSSAIATTVHVHPDEETAREMGEEYWRRTSAMTMWHYDRMGSDHFMPNATDEERERLVRAGYEDQASAGIFGTPESVIDQIRELQRVADVGHLITLHSFGDMPTPMVEASMKLFAEEVLPTIKTFGSTDPRAIPYSDVMASSLAKG
ncbi:LLM class flavin-dependent oxidoreductase [Aeromicrobium panaciterrae]|uniref:LLM class flavin-dependent oxidoreductase n=1 Tax=Aeromicrobium panaciterrae TaxID=363861 RepID=UPI0031DBE8E5